MARYIQRHSKQARWTHNIHLLSCAVLVLSGVVVFVPAVSQAVGYSVVQAVRLAHRIFAVVFIAIPIFSMLKSPKGFMHMVKEMLAPWDKDDWRFLALFVPYLFAPKKVHMPKQHETKSGQRLADGMLVLFPILISISGVLLWAGKYIDPALFRWSLLVHDVSFIMIVIVGMAHGYLGAGIFQPYRGSARLMFGDGKVSESDALYHWGYWAEDELKSGKNVTKE